MTGYAGRDTSVKTHIAFILTKVERTSSHFHFYFVFLNYCFQMSALDPFSYQSVNTHKKISHIFIEKGELF